jgi:hypothetical protein
LLNLNDFAPWNPCEECDLLLRQTTTLARGADGLSEASKEN